MKFPPYGPPWVPPGQWAPKKVWGVPLPSALVVVVVVVVVVIVVVDAVVVFVLILHMIRGTFGRRHIT